MKVESPLQGCPKCGGLEFMASISVDYADVPLTAQPDPSDGNYPYTYDLSDGFSWQEGLSHLTCTKCSTTYWPENVGEDENWETED